MHDNNQHQERVIDSKFAARFLDGRIEIVNRETGKPIPQDEPMFLIRGQDRIGRAMVFKYLEESRMLARPSEFIDSLEKTEELFRRFQQGRRTKLPD